MASPEAASIEVPLVVPQMGDDEVAAVSAVLRSGQLAAGREVEAFEREFAPLAGCAHAVAMNSGTAAIHAGLAALGIGDGDEVLTTPFTFAASASPILMQRGVPRFVDVDPRTFDLDAPAALRAASGRTKAAILVDLFGLPYDAAATEALRARGVKVFEDACQAVGARRDGEPAGSRGVAASFSFYATKNMTTGEGGMLVTDDGALAAAAPCFRHHGQGETYQYLSLGYNYRMTEMAAAIGRVQLTRLPAATAARRSNAAFYDRELAGLDGVTLPQVPAGAEHVYHQYSILIDARATHSGVDRDRVRARLAERKIGSGIYYPKPLHLHPLFAPYGHGPGDFPVAERLASSILALPVHPALTRNQLEHVVTTLRSAVGGAA